MDIDIVKVPFPLLIDTILANDFENTWATVSSNFVFFQCSCIFIENVLT